MSISEAFDLLIAIYRKIDPYTLHNKFQDPQVLLLWEQNDQNIVKFYDALVTDEHRIIFFETIGVEDIDLIRKACSILSLVSTRVSQVRYEVKQFLIYSRNLAVSLKGLSPTVLEMFTKWAESTFTEAEIANAIDQHLNTFSNITIDISNPRRRPTVVPYPDELPAPSPQKIVFQSQADPNQSARPYIAPKNVPISREAILAARRIHSTSNIQMPSSVRIHLIKNRPNIVAQSQPIRVRTGTVDNRATPARAVPARAVPARATQSARDIPNRAVPARADWATRVARDIPARADWAPRGAPTRPSTANSRPNNQILGYSIYNGTKPKQIGIPPEKRIKTMAELKKAFGEI